MPRRCEQGILESYGVYAKTGVDTMMSMAGTYYGTNLSKNKHNVELELDQGPSHHSNTCEQP